MGKMYSLDKKLICGSPEIRIGDKVYSIDNRNKTVRQVMAIFDEKKDDDNRLESYERMDRILEIAFGKNYKEIEGLELSFEATNELVKIVVSALTGKDDEVEKTDDNFRESEGEMV